MTRQQQMDSEDMQRALMMLWCVTPECIASNDAMEWKQLTPGVLLCRDRGIGGTGAFYLWDGRDRRSIGAEGFAQAVRERAVRA